MASVTRISGVSPAILARQAWACKSERDVRALIAAASRSSQLHWRPVGDRPNNIGTIRIASDPALSMVERITNAIDAMLELGRAANTGPDPINPRQAAQRWFGIPTGGIAEMTDGERRSLGANIAISLADSGEAKRPTVIVDDRGIGQHPSRFPKTLLSLNENNKVGKQWTMGTYGQGGSTTYGFSRAAILISCRHPSHSEGGEDRIGWTVVIEEETDPATYVLPSYKYLVGPDNEVLSAEPGALPDLPNGTRCIHIAYDAPQWATTFTTELWQFLHAALFDPVLPFLVTSTRANDSKFGSRIIIGNAARLESPHKAKGEVEVAHKDSHKVDLGHQYGGLTVRYWVVRRPEGSEKESDAAAGYVRADAAVATTLFGQRQDAEPRIWIKDNAWLPFLYKNLIVQLDADQLTAVAKRELFASTRERATKSELKSAILSHLAAILQSDDELKRLNYEEKERLLQRSTSAANERVRNRLRRFIKTHLKDLKRPVPVGQESNGHRKDVKRHQRGGPSKRSTDDSSLHNAPTFLRFQSHRLRIYRGGMAYVWVEIDAKNGYLPRHDDELTLFWEEKNPGAGVRLTARSELLGGKCRWLFAADEDAQVGEFKLRAELMTVNGLLADAAIFLVADRPPTKEARTKDEPETGPDVRWVFRDAWPEHDNMDGHTVGYVSEDVDSTIIWVNRHYEPLDKALSGSRMTPEAIGTGADRYQYPVACGLWLQHHAELHAAQKPDEKYRKQEMQRLAEAVIAAIYPDVDVAIEDSEA